MQLAVMQLAVMQLAVMQLAVMQLAVMQLAVNSNTVSSNTVIQLMFLILSHKLSHCITISLHLSHYICLTTFVSLSHYFLQFIYCFKESKYIFYRGVVLHVVSWSKYVPTTFTKYFYSAFYLIFNLLWSTVWH